MNRLKRYNKVKVRKYNTRTIFKSTKCDLIIQKDKEKRLKQIIKEIDKLSNEMEKLFRKEKGGTE